MIVSKNKNDLNGREHEHCSESGLWLLPSVKCGNNLVESDYKERKELCVGS